MLTPQRRKLSSVFFQVILNALRENQVQGWSSRRPDCRQTGRGRGYQDDLDTDWLLDSGYDGNTETTDSISCFLVSGLGQWEMFPQYERRTLGAHCTNDTTNTDVIMKIIDTIHTAGILYVRIKMLTILNKYEPLTVNRMDYQPKYHMYSVS